MPIIPKNKVIGQSEEDDKLLRGLSTQRSGQVASAEQVAGAGGLGQTQRNDDAMVSQQEGPAMQNGGTVRSAPGSVRAPAAAAPLPTQGKTAISGSNAHQDNTGMGALDPANLGDVNQDDLNLMALLRAQGLLGAGNPVTQADLDRQRSLGQQATAQEVGDLKAQFGAGGFGASAAAGLASADISRIGREKTEEAVSQAAALGRQEQLQNILAGAGLAQSTGRFDTEQQREALLQQLIGQELKGDDTVLGGDGSVPGSNLDNSTQNQFMQDLTNRARQDVQNNPVDPVTGALIGTLGFLGDLYEGTPFDGGQSFPPVATPGTDLSGFSYIGTSEDRETGKIYAIYQNKDDPSIERMVEV